MELIQTLIEEKLQNHMDYIFCLDVDSKFHGRWGTESLGALVAVIHPGQETPNVCPRPQKPSACCCQLLLASRCGSQSRLKS